jgi:hypothetical protein
MSDMPATVNRKWLCFGAFLMGFNFGLIPYDVLAIVYDWQPGPVVMAIRGWIGL